MSWVPVKTKPSVVGWFATKPHCSAASPVLQAENVRCRSASMRPEDSAVGRDPEVRGLSRRDVRENGLMHVVVNAETDVRRILSRPLLVAFLEIEDKIAVVGPRGGARNRPLVPLPGRSKTAPPRTMLFNPWGPPLSPGRYSDSSSVPKRSFGTLPNADRSSRRCARASGRS